MSPEQILLAALAQALVNWSIRCKLVQGMWIVEAVAPANAPQVNKPQLFQQIRNIIAQNQTTAPHPIWKLFVYQQDSDRFTVNGTLHTVPSSYSHDGIYTTTLSGLDCYVDISEFDGEALQLGYQAGDVVQAKEAVNSNNVPVLPYQNGANHIWLESLGGEYGIAQNGVVAIGQQHPLRIDITLG